MGTPYNSAPFSGPGNSVNFAQLSSATTILPANASRKFLRICVTAVGTPTPAYFTIDGTVPSSTNGFVLTNSTAGMPSVIEFGPSFVPTGEIKAFGGNGINVIWA